MISVLSAVNIAFSVAGITISMLGLIQAFTSRRLEGWNRRFFIFLFMIMNVYIGSVFIYSISTAMGVQGNVRVSETAMFIQSFSSSILMQMMALLLRHFIWENSPERLEKQGFPGL